jgi:hypothetical protein
MDRSMEIVRMLGILEQFVDAVEGFEITVVAVAVAVAAVAAVAVE